MFKTLKKIPYWYLIAIPLLAIGIGAASNQAVLIANGGKFPVQVNAEEQAKLCVAPKADADYALPSAHRQEPAEPSAPDMNTCANGGEYLDEVHTIMNSQSHLKAFADIFNLGAATYSIGDFLLILGEWMWGWSCIAWCVLVIRKFVEM